jgi:hypothetical protein
LEFLAVQSDTEARAEHHLLSELTHHFCYRVFETVVPSQLDQIHAVHARSHFEVEVFSVGQGADLSRLTSSYSECLDLFRYALDFLSSDDKEWVLGRALAQALNWPE